MIAPSLISGSSGKALGLKLVGRFEALLARQELSAEMAYRLNKMRQGLLPLLDRVYLKTIKGQEMLQECLSKIEDIEDRGLAPDDTAFLLLTELERTYEDLLQKIYEFRVKAG